jgi:hypothetical protein
MLRLPGLKMRLWSNHPPRYVCLGGTESQPTSFFAPDADRDEDWVMARVVYMPGEQISEVIRKKGANLVNRCVRP